MKKPDELIDLLEDLKDSISTPSASIVDRDAKMSVFIGRGQMNVSAQDSLFILHDEESVLKFYESLGSPDDCAVEIYDIDVTDEVIEALEKSFSTVDVF